MVEAVSEPLMETATRYEHWSELLDAFRNAVVIIDRDYPPTLRTSGAIAMHANRVKIESAIELVESQLNKFSNRERAEYGLRNLVNSLPKAEEINDNEQRLLSTGETVQPHEAPEPGGRDETIPPDVNC
jgi:hypothetical protein